MFFKYKIRGSKYTKIVAFGEYIPDFMDNGIDILNPVKITAKGMDPEFLKDSFGEELVFWGGYVFNNVHNIQAGVPPENILAMYEAAYEYGVY